MIKAQLCVPADRGNVGKYLESPEYWMERKFNGRRFLCYATDEGVIGFNRSVEVIDVPGTVRSGLAKLRPHGMEIMLDGEWVNDTYAVFDLLLCRRQSIPIISPFSPLSVRREQMEGLWRGFKHDDFGLVACAKDRAAKYSLYAECVTDQAEGVVFKRWDSPHHDGKHWSNDWVKIKFVKEADCVVVQVGENGKHNLVLAVYDGDRRVRVGKVSALTGDGPEIRRGDVVTVSYLMISDAGKLVQPTTPKLRRDKMPRECTLQSLLREDALTW